jgi:hypothetical protein
LLFELTFAVAGPGPGAGDDEADACGPGDFYEPGAAAGGVGGEAAGKVGGPLLDRPRVLWLNDWPDSSVSPGQIGCLMPIHLSSDS